MVWRENIYFIIVSSNLLIASLSRFTQSHIHYLLQHVVPISVQFMLRNVLADVHPCIMFTIRFLWLRESMRRLPRVVMSEKAHLLTCWQQTEVFSRRSEQDSTSRRSTRNPSGHRQVRAISIYTLDHQHRLENKSFKINRENVPWLGITVDRWRIKWEKKVTMCPRFYGDANWHL